MVSYWIGKVIAAFFIIVIAAIIILLLLIPVFTQGTLVATVTGKEIYTTTSCSDDSCTSDTHLTVYTDKEVIEISDSLIFWSFGEQQKYGKLKEGKTYEFKVWGFNVPILQMYRGAYEYVEVI